MGTGAAHRWHDEISHPEPLRRQAPLHDLDRGLVADHQVIISGQRRAVLKGTDLLVGAADADDFQHPQHDLVRLG